MHHLIGLGVVLNENKDDSKSTLFSLLEPKKKVDLISSIFENIQKIRAKL